MLITIISSLAQEESRNISTNVTWGLRKRFADGKVSLPYGQFLGYRKGEDGLPEIVESEAKTVRLIYKLFLEGKTPHGIAKYLSQKGIFTPSGKSKWQASTVQSILTNEKYKGHALLQKSLTVDFLTKKKKVNEGEVPQYYVENSHTHIISEETFELVQEEFRRRRSAMMEDCRSGMIDLVMTKSISRLGRNTVDSLNAVRELKALDTGVFFEKENINTLSGEGELMLTVLMAFAEAENMSISENVKWGMRKKAQQGHTSVFGCRPYGYDKGANGFVINEIEAAIVRRVYQEFLDGYTYGDIVYRLNDDGIPTYTGRGQWSIVQIMQMLQNEKYRGDCCYQSTYVADPISKKKRKNKGELPRYYLSETHPYIIEPLLWECVQLEMKRRSEYMKKHHTLSSRTSHNTLMVGKVICKECGYSYSLLGHTTYLTCTAREKIPHPEDRDRLTCQKIRLPKKAPENLFISAWNQLVDQFSEFAPNWEKILQKGDALQRYRAKELMRLVEETGPTDKFTYELMLKTLDHLEVGNDGMAEVIFLAGTRIEVRFYDLGSAAISVYTAIFKIDVL